MLQMALLIYDTVGEPNIVLNIVISLSNEVTKYYY